MTAVARRLLDQALDLSIDDRAQLAHELLISLDRRQPGASESWLAEIDDRTRAAIAGERGVVWSAARAELESSLTDR